VVYLTICFFFGLAGGVVGRIKGSSFVLWFLISAIVPVIGLLAAVLYRFEGDELRRECPNCGRICMLYDAVCTRCGTDLEFPDVAIAPESQTTGTRASFPANS
jgi:peptidoglycan/LPS O-acetylase OafA/YrhL